MDFKMMETLPITVVNALRTSRELTEFMKARGRPPHSPDRVDLDAFLFSKTATSAPSRSLASLKWLNTNGQLQWDVNELTLPPQTNPRNKKGQAPVITPPMLPFLEEQAEAMCLVGDEKWTCLLAGWVIATGCLRSVMSSIQLIPSTDLPPEETIQALGRNFKLDKPVIDYLLKSGIENLEEFRFFWDAEDKIEPWLNKIGLKDEEKNIQGARVRRAWAAVRLWFTQSEQDRSKVATSDLDSMLQESELRDVKSTFWIRYRQRFPPEVHPSDSTLSRVSREMSKRMLCVFAIWKVRSLQFQLHTTNKKRKLADGLFTEEQDEDDGCGRDWEAYLDKLQTLMLAYSMAGASGVTGAFGAAQEHGLGSDSCRFVQVPLDVMQAYYYRAKRTTCLLPPAKRLAWLQSKDAEERSEWVARFRESTASLGQIVKEVYTLRDAHWVPPPILPLADSPAGVPSSGTSKDNGGTNHFALGKPINGKQVAKVLKDGSRLCQAFQHGQCKQKTPCPNGQHRCGLVVKKERVCGAGGHGASSCKTIPKGA